MNFYIKFFYISNQFIYKYLKMIYKGSMKKILKNFKKQIYWFFYNLYNKKCKNKLGLKVKNIEKILDEYSAKSKSTGIKYSSLLACVELIQKYKPLILLESGTGVSTIAIAETLYQLKINDPQYKPILISMESIDSWYKMALNLLPERYKEFVEIRFGEREVFSYKLFRGFKHKNIPHLNYDFVLVDGPNYDDEFGSACCMDAVFARLKSESPRIFGVIDTRVSTVWVMQKIFGTNSLKYFSIFRTSKFSLRRLNEFQKGFNFSNNILGELKLKYK